MQVFLNGRFVSAARARVSVFDPGLTAGEGVFESVLFRNGTLQFLHEHLARMRHSARILGIKIPFTEARLREIIHTLIAKNRLVKSSVRITLTPESFVVTARDFPHARPATASVTFVKMERALPYIKSLNYLPTVLAQRIAAQKRFDEALLVDRDGFVTEGGRTNFFWVKAGRLFTPSLGNALPGITREKVLTLARKLRLKIVEKKVRVAEISAADEIFLTNAPMEIWPVTRLEKRKLPVGVVTEKIRAAYAKKFGGCS